MRRLLLALCTLTPPAYAQVSTNNQALDTLKSPPPPPAETQDTKPVRPRPRHTAPRHTPTSASVLKPGQKLPKVPPAPPPNPVIAPPPLVMPNHPPPPPPPVPLRADASGQASPIKGGTRITFAPGDSTLNPATFNAIKSVANAALAAPGTSIDVIAWAPGKADDPSTPRRLSLDRALAVRAVLINAGLPSERIHAIARGMNDIGVAPPDRVDILPLAPKPVAPPQAQK